VGLVSDYIFGTSANDVPKAVTETLYIDVSKVCIVTVKGNVTVTTPASSNIIQHMELTKTNDGFTYRGYTPGILPLPVTL
jgi:hypothetical protein